MVSDRINVLAVLSALILGILFQTVAQEVYPGLALYSSGNNAYLYNEEKELVHTYRSDYRAAGAPRLMRDSSVIFPGRNPNGWSGGALTAGQFQIITWDGEIVWDFNYACSDYCPHHNFEIMYFTDDQDEVPHILAACYEKPSGTSRLCDKLVEIKPTGATTGEIVWEWHAWDHRTSDPDNHPELLKSPSERQMGDWNHVNNISFNRELDQLVVDMKSFDEFVIIDHSTTTEEAAGHSGGDYGMGGDLLYRWGQASNYGISGSDYIRGFHAGIWIPSVFPGTNLEIPGAGNVMLYHNNGDEVVEIELPGEGDGVYPREPGEAWGPASPAWTYDINASSHEGSVQRMPNGNTFICDQGGPMYEVTENGQEVWRLDKGGNQALKYAYSYLDPETYAKKKKNMLLQSIPLRIYTNPVTGYVHISLPGAENNAEISIVSVNGKTVFSQVIKQSNAIWNTEGHAGGMYFVRVQNGINLYSQYVKVIQ